jgi:hypothetical protein
MADTTSFIQTIKKAALGAVDASYPVQSCFGEVISASPLKIKVEQKITLEPIQLILTRNVTDYYVDMSVSHQTELETEHIHPVIDTYTGGGTSTPTQHLHEYKNKKRFLVHNALKVGEQVLLIREQGGQRCIVIDRVASSPDLTNGEWI